jgi:50S ribosomal protein L16 3-hydroxylase
MIIFNDISIEDFFQSYWQKKPLLLKQGLPNFVSPVSANDLAGFSLEKEFESRIVKGSYSDQRWTVKNGPFTNELYSSLPDNDWTLLVQGVDRHVHEISDLVSHFDFIPRWRFDDVMISFASEGGSVGPHFDYYDVFLVQGSGKRRWHLSTNDCSDNNYLRNTEIKIMQKFEAEETFDVVPGDVLYIPPNVAHHGVSLDNNCTTLSFGYRSYSDQEMGEFVEKFAASKDKTQYYQDPLWSHSYAPALITESAIHQAKKLIDMSGHEFACFVTRMDPLDDRILQYFMLCENVHSFDKYAVYVIHPSCRIAYTISGYEINVYLNGEKVITDSSNHEHLMDFCNKRKIDCNKDGNASVSLASKLFEMGVLYKAM